MYKQIGIVFGVLIALIGMGMATNDITFSESINRPGNFVYTDTATMSGWNTWQHMSSSDAGSFAAASTFSLLDVPQGSAPLETSFEQMNLDFTKYGTMSDPCMGEIVQSGVTVGAVGGIGANHPTIGTLGATAGQLIGDANDRYDLAQYNMMASGDYLNGFQVSSLLFSSQDDYLSAEGYDSAGTGDIIPTSYALITKGWDSQAYSELNWQDTRGWTPVSGDPNGVWDISTMVEFQNYPIAFNVGR